MLSIALVFIQQFILYIFTKLSSNGLGPHFETTRLELPTVLNFILFGNVFMGTIVASLQNGPIDLCLLVFKPLYGVISQLNTILEKGQCLPRLGHKRHCSFFYLPLSWIPPLESQLQYHKDTQAALWRGAIWQKTKASPKASTNSPGMWVSDLETGSSSSSQAFRLPQPQKRPQARTTQESHPKLLIPKKCGR